jgi:2-haloacid dehalogenase
MTSEFPQAFVFDAYGTLFDVHSVAVLADELAPGRGAELSRTWRGKQLEYTWLSSLMASPSQPRRDFDDLTACALDQAVETLRLPLDGDARRRLCAAYLTLSPFPDARGTLAALAPRPCRILSNGTAASLATLVQNSGLAPLLTGVWSVDEVDVYKPSPRVYELAQERLGLPAARIGFVSANAWDAIGAQAFGFTSFWINRNGAPLDRHGAPPRHTLRSLAELPPTIT